VSVSVFVGRGCAANSNRASNGESRKSGSFIPNCFARQDVVVDISLCDVLSGKRLEEPAQSLRTKGWVLLRNDNLALKACVDGLEVVAKWFQLPIEEKRVWREWLATAFPNAEYLYGVGGHGESEGKESFRCLTGTELEKGKEYIPLPFRAQLCAAAVEMDLILDKLLSLLCMPLLGITRERLCIDHDVPFLPGVLTKVEELEEQWNNSAVVLGRNKETARPALQHSNGDAFCVLDVAWYSNKSDLKRERNCAAHHDPFVFCGLTLLCFTISAIAACFR
jgi:hypothetical protein